MASDLQIIACPHPFRAEHVRLTLPAGKSIAEIIATVQPQAELRRQAHVFLDGRPILRAMWESTQPRSGQEIIVRMVPGGGGGKKNPLSTILMIGVIAAAAYTGNLAVFAKGGAMFFGGAGGALASAAVGTLGMLAVNAIAPPPRQSLAALSGADRASATYSLGGGRNRLNPYGAVPRVLGRHLLVPPYAAKPYTELVGQDQYMRFIFLLGYGPLLIESPQIGETSIWDYEGTQFEVRQGFSDDPPLSLFPDSVTEESLASTLSMPYEGADGWVTRTTAPEIDELGIEITFPSGLVRFDEAGNKQPTSVQVTAQYRQLPSGPWLNLAPIVAYGSPQTIRLPNAPFGYWQWVGPDAEDYAHVGERYDLITIERVSGALNIRSGAESTEAAPVAAIPATPWGHYAVCAVRRGPYPPVTVGPGDLTDLRDPILTASGGGNFLATLADPRTISVDVGDYPSGYLTVIAAKPSALRYGVSTKVPYKGQYEVRLRRETLDSASDKIFDVVAWTLLRSINHRQPVAISKLPNMALAVLRVKATDSLSGIIDQFSVVATSILPAWDGSTWSEQPTNNPGAIARAILQGPANDKPALDSDLDLPALEDLSTACTVNGWTFNAVIEQRTTAKQLLNDVLSTARASDGRRDGIHTIIRDQVQTAHWGHLTPRNSVDCRGEKIFNNPPHALRVQFINAALGWRQDEITVYDDGYDVTTASRFETLDLYGTTDAGQAWKRGRFYLAAIRLRPELHSRTVDFEHLTFTRGDLIRVTDDVAMHGITSGRVKNLLIDSDSESPTYGQALSVTLDELCPMEEGKTYAIRVRREDGSSLYRAVATVAGEHDELTFNVPLTSVDFPEIDNLVSFGESEQETAEKIVTRIEMLSDLAARVYYVDAAPAIHEADSGVIPPYDPQITIPADITTMAPALPQILGLVSDDRALLRRPDGTILSRILVAICAGNGGAQRTSRFELHYRQSGETSPWITLPAIDAGGGEIAIDGVEDLVTYDLRLRALSAYGIASAWVETTHTVLGKSTPPPAPDTFLVRALPDGTREFTARLAAPPVDFAGFQFRARLGTWTWDDMTPLHEGVIAATPWETNQLAAGDYTLACKSIDSTGNLSTSAVYIALTLPDPRLAGALAIYRDHADGWPGTKTGCYVVPESGYLGALDTKAWADQASWDSYTQWNDTPVSPITYLREIDIGVITTYTPLITVIAEGTVTILEQHSDDASSWSSLAPPAGPVTARYQRWQISVAGTLPVLQSVVTILSAKITTAGVEDLNTSTLTGAYRIGVGDIRLPLGTAFATILRINSIALQNVAAGWSWVLIDKDTSVGPRIKIYDQTNTLADAVIDAAVDGIPL